MTDHNHVPSRRHDGKANMYAILRQLEFIENANAVGVFNDTPEVYVPHTISSLLVSGDVNSDMNL